MERLIRDPKGIHEIGAISKVSGISVDNCVRKNY